MVTKELIENRWKLVGGGALVALMALITVFTYELTKGVMNGQAGAKLPGFIHDYIVQMTATFDTFVWASWFSMSNNGGLVMVALAAILGAGLIAGEVGKGSIFLLLSKPISRERVLLTKYAVSAAMLLAVVLFGSLVLLIVTALMGHPQNIGGTLVSDLLFWLALLFTLGVATLFSVIFSDVLRPLALTLVVMLLVALPGFVPGGHDWSLPSYWTSLPAYLGQSFPLKEFVVAIIVAALPLIIVVPLFRRQQY